MKTPNEKDPPSMDAFSCLLLPLHSSNSSSLLFEPRKLHIFTLPLLKELLSHSMQDDSADLHEGKYNLLKM